LGPSCAVVEIKDEKVTCWTASQAPNRLKRQLAAMLALPPNDVHCIYVEGSGCYGRNGHEDAAGDAALLSRAVDGRPVRVQWMRRDEVRGVTERPAVRGRLRRRARRAGEVSGLGDGFFAPNA